MSLFVIATTLAYSLAPVTCVLKNDGDHITVKLRDYSSGLPVQVGDSASRTIPTITPNGSGISTFILGEGDPDWGNIPPSAVNSKVLVEIYDNGSLIRQTRLDDLIERAAINEKATKLRVAKFTADSAATFEQQVEIKGPLVRSSSNFTDSLSFTSIVSNIMIYTGYNQLLNITESDFNPQLTNGTTYTIVNNNINLNVLNILLDNGDNVSLNTYDSTTIIKLGNALYFVSKP